MNIQACGNVFSSHDEFYKPVSGSRAAFGESVISIYSVTSASFLSVKTDSVVYGNSSVQGNREKFAVITNSDGSVSFKSEATDLYLTVSGPSSSVTASASSIGTEQKFYITNRGDGSYSIWSNKTSTHLNVNPNSSNVLKAQWNDWDGDWQQFYINTIGSTSDKVIGVDLSEALYAQKKGVVFRDQNGNAKDVFDIFYENGYKWLRVRVNIEPDSNDYAMFTDLAYATEVGVIAKELGFKLLVDFHYSNWWADPGNQWTPYSWRTSSITALCTTAYNWTVGAMQTLINAGAEPDMVQIGNEINYGIMWDLGNVGTSTSNWTNVAWLINSGINAVEDAGSDADIMIHTATGGSWSETSSWISNFINAGGQWSDVDAYGVSYYPMWHGSTSDLSYNMAMLDRTYDKDIYVIETAYYWDTNECGYSGSEVPYSQNEQGQYDFLQAVKSAVSSYSDVKGIFYWGAAWAQSNKWLSASGWDNDDASRRSLFDDNGYATKGLTGLID